MRELRLTHEADLEVDCGECHATVGEECKGLVLLAASVERAVPSPDKVHFARRMANICRDPEARACVEAAFGDHKGDA